MPPIKPGRWSVNPGDVDSRFLNLWEGLISLVPIWENNPAVKDLIWTGGANNPATPTNLTTQLGKYGPHLAFDGTDDYIEWDASDSPYEGLTELSWAILIRLNSVGGPQALIRKDGTFNFEFSIDGGQTRWIVGLWPGGTLDFNYYLDPLAIDTWYLVVGTWRDADDLVTLYQLDDSTGIVTIDSQTETQTGALGNTGSNQFRWGTTEAGSADANADIAFYSAWNRKLSEREARQIIADPFGFIRPRVQTLPSFSSLYATADQTLFDVVDELDTTINLFDSINDDPDAPTDTDWINNEVTP